MFAYDTDGLNGPSVLQLVQIPGKLSSSRVFPRPSLRVQGS